MLAPPLAVRPVLERLARSLAKLHAPHEDGPDGARGVRFDVDVDPGFRVRVADVDLHELLGNVLENACKYGASTIRVLAPEAGDAVVVEDDGPGFPPDMERLARRGERADTRVAGEGLGLAASRELLESHGGTLELGRSAEGGARVTLRFAAAQGLAMM